MEIIVANPAFQMQASAEQIQPLLNVARHISHARPRAGQQNVRVGLVLRRDEFATRRPTNRGNSPTLILLSW